MQLRRATKMNISEQSSSAERLPALEKLETFRLDEVLTWNSAAKHRNQSIYICKNPL